MPKTYESISSFSPSSQSSITFNSIPQTYTDLVIIYSITNSLGNQNTFLRFNSDSNNNYATSYMYGSGNGNSVSAGYYNTLSAVFLDVYGYPGTTANSIGIVNIFSYSNSNIYKSVLNNASRIDSGIQRSKSLWKSNSSINSILFYPGSGTISGTISLYGIKTA